MQWQELGTQQKCERCKVIVFAVYCAFFFSCEKQASSGWHQSFLLEDLC